MLCGDDPGPGGSVLGFLTKEYKMRGFVCLGLGVLLFLAWAISYFVFHVPGVRISFASDLCARIIHVLHVHWKTRSRIMVGFARDEIEERVAPRIL